MKNRILLSVIFLFFFTFLKSQIVVPDTIHNIQWELLDAPSGKATGFAKSGNRLFAAPHFYSDDLGENWKRIPKVFEMNKIVASDEAVFLEDDKIVKLDPGGVTNERRFFKSKHGISDFERNVAEQTHNGGRNTQYIFKVSHLQKKNDSTFFYTKTTDFYSNPLNSSGELLFTSNEGITWQSRSYFFDDNISAAEDTVLGFDYVKNEAYLFGNDNFSSPIIDNFGSSGKNLIYVKGKYFQLGHDGRTVRASTNRGANWTTVQMPFYPSRKLIGQFEYADNFIFIAAEDEVYKMSIDPPFEIESVYQSDFKFKKSLLVFGIFDNIWLTSDLDGIHRSIDKGITWERKTKGLTNYDDSVFDTGSAERKYILGGERFYLGAGDSMRRSSPTANTWEILRDSFFINHTLWGTAGGYLWASRNSDFQLFRSYDSGITWEELTGYTGGGEIFETPDRIFMGRNYSDDGGNTWTSFISPYNDFTVVRDTFISFKNIWNTENAIRSISIDRGQTWENDTVFNFQVNDLGVKGDTIFNFYESRVLYSLDNGKNWIKTSQLAPLFCYSTNSCDPAVLNGFVKGVLVANAGGKMYVSRNLGHNWNVIKDVPFGDSLYNPFIRAGGYVEGGGFYHFKDDYLYAFKKGQGLWRTAFAPISNSLPINSEGIGEIKGRIFKDLNNNCIFDPSVDKPLAFKPIRISNQITETDSEGNYTAFLLPGIFEVSTQKPLYHDLGCLGADTVSVRIDSSGIHNIDFPLTPQPGIYDLKVSLSTGNRARPGFQNYFKLTVKNLGTETVSGTPVIFSFDPAKYEVIDAGGGDISTGSITFYPNLAPDECAVYDLQLRLFPTVPLGTIDIVTAGVDLPNDIDLSNNKVILEREVRGSYDPNDKTAFTDKHILPFTENEVEYLIRFQNTGTDTAFTVRVADTLDTKFDLLTLEMIATSHPFELKVKNDGAVQWTFQNILLPDSTINEPLSHGFIYFSIKTKPDVSDTDTLRNEASIYFDFNEPIITNEVIDQVEKGVYTQTDSLTICEGDEINGVPIFESSIFSDTLSGTIWDSIFVTQIEVLPVYSIVQNLSFSPGDTFNGVPIYVDTVFVENFIAQNGCDSVVTTNLSIVSGVGDLNAENGFFKVFPNPILDEMTVEVFSEMSTRSTIVIYDILGKPLLRQAVNLKGGYNSISVDASALPSGILTVTMSPNHPYLRQVRVMKIAD